jgi:myo-inositol-1(or 4)-monophosphatase
MDAPADALVDELQQLAVAVATDAAALLMEGRHGHVAVAATKSSATDVVTVMDRASEALVAERVRAVRPDDGILGEEGSDTAGTSGVRWVVDPLDGTVNYLYGLPSWAVSVAAEYHGDAVVGVVAVPTLGETYVAVRGRGAQLHADGSVVDLAVRPSVPCAEALVATGFGYTVDRRRTQAAVAAALLPQIRDIRRAGACATDLCHVAAGRLDAYYELGPQPWDHAAGGLVAREAGARFALLALPGEADPLVLAATPELFADLRERLLGLHGAGG